MSALRLIMHGNLGADATVNNIERVGKWVVSFSLAHTEKFNQEERTTWVRCSWWLKNEPNDNLMGMLTKGSKVYVEGTPSASAYTDQQGGVRANLELNVQKLSL